MIRDLSTKLKDLRTKLGYSQTFVAKQIKISPPIISSYESGTKSPSLESLVALAHLYKCSTDYLLGLTDITTRKTLQPFTDEQAMALISFVNNNRTY